ncbi:hypothetical protein NFO65_18565 [Neorhizobium galegae]|uniref:hypothetical protein n=1 Tax=Neorhizobium galegae TaxID=399 RepID=UPI0021011C98|nr:hypothetical protein [Neorhizobium galegae]MCQ1572735.1 hypothetical protein [Neorhizobium galegae]
MQSSSRLARIPVGNFDKFGFGLGAVGVGTWDRRRDAVERAKAIFDRRAPALWSPELYQSLVTVREMFQKIRCENSVDWFTTCRLFGMPSGKLAGKFQKALRDAIEALRSRSEGEFDAIFDRLDRDAFGDILAAYISATDPTHPHFHRELYGWVGLAWSSSHVNEVMICTTAGRAQQMLAPKIEGQHPFGLLAAWNVCDAHLAREELAELFGDALGLEPVRVRSHDSHLLEIKQDVEAILLQENLLALSPWHEIKPQKRQTEWSPPIDTQEIGADPHGFSPEVSEIFASFNRR